MQRTYQAVYGPSDVIGVPLSRINDIRENHACGAPSYTSLSYAVIAPCARPSDKPSAATEMAMPDTAVAGPPKQPEDGSAAEREDFDAVKVRLAGA